MTTLGFPFATAITTINEAYHKDCSFKSTCMWCLWLWIQVFEVNLQARELFSKIFK